MEWQNMKESASDSAIYSGTDIPLYSSSGNYNAHPLQPQPYLEILVQPQSKFRFRYKSEMTGKHGSLLGSSEGGPNPSSSTSNCPSPNGSKIYPTVKLHNYPGPAIIRCSLACASPPFFPHPHVLHTFEMGGGNLTQTFPTLSSPGFMTDDSYAQIEVTDENEHTASFQGMNIIYTGKKGIKKELMHKSAQLEIGDSRKIRPDKIEELSLGINLNVVLLYFEAYIRKPDSTLQSICCPVVSTPIQHNKSTQTSDLRIVRIDKYTSCCTGDEEVFLLVEKVDKHNIQVRFFEENEKGIEVWKAYGKFSKLDVHHQYAIVFKTPPYRSFEIDTEEDVYLQLERPSDGATSQPIPFKYKPIERIRKMPKKQKSRAGNDSQGSSSRSLPPPGREPDSNQPRDSEAEGSEQGNNPNDGNEAGSVRQGCDQKFPCDLAKITQNEQKAIALSVALNVGSALHSWAESSDFSFVLQKLRHLLCLGNEFGDNALHTAILNQQKEPFQRILSTISSSPDVASTINEPNLQSLTPLSVAVLTGGEDYVQDLLKHNADMSITNSIGDTPIHLAIKSNHINCLKILLKDPFSRQIINHYNYNSMTAIHIAVAESNLEAIHLLLNANASLMVQEGTYGRTPLHIAVEKGNFSSSAMLLKAGGEDSNIIDMQNYRGDTPLHCAVSAELIPICALLMLFGADTSIENFHQKELGEDEDTKYKLGHTVFDEATSDDIKDILSGDIQCWEAVIKPFINLQDSLPETEKLVSPDNIPQDSGIDIKELNVF